MKTSLTLSLLALVFGLQAAPAADAPFQFLLHPYGPLVIGKVEGQPRAFLGPNDLEVFISFGGEGEGDLTSDSPDVPKIEGQWKDGLFLKTDGTSYPPLKVEMGEAEPETTLEGTLDEEVKLSLRLVFYKGGLVTGRLIHGGDTLELTGCRFDTDRLVLVSKDFRFGASLWKTTEGGKTTWAGMGALDDKGDAWVSVEEVEGQE